MNEILTGNEDITTVRIKKLGGSVLNPISLMPYESDGSPNQQSLEAISLAYVEARNNSSAPADVLKLAIDINFAERFRKMDESIKKFVFNNDGSPEWSRVFVMHSHINPEAAAAFFKKFDGMPSIDLAAAVCTPDSRDLTTEVLRKTRGNFVDTMKVDDREVRLKMNEYDSSAGESYSIVTVKKIIAVNDRQGFNFKRRKTYITPTINLVAHDLERPEDLQAYFGDNPDTHPCLEPVIESIFIERTQS